VYVKANDVKSGLKLWVGATLVVEASALSSETFLGGIHQSIDDPGEEKGPISIRRTSNLAFKMAEVGFGRLLGCSGYFNSRFDNYVSFVCKRRFGHFEELD